MKNTSDYKFKNPYLLAEKEMERWMKITSEVNKLNLKDEPKLHLQTFIAFLGKDEKPFSSERFMNVGPDYLRAFLDPAVNAGILIRTGEQNKATYRVTY